MSDITPQYELDDRALRPEIRDEVNVRPLDRDEDGTKCIACGQPIRYRPPETNKPRKMVAVLFGGAMCCSQQCLQVESGRRDDEEQAEEDAAMQWAEEQGYL